MTETTQPVQTGTDVQAPPLPGFSGGKPGGWKRDKIALNDPDGGEPVEFPCLVLGNLAVVRGFHGGWFQVLHHRTGLGFGFTGLQRECKAMVAALRDGFGDLSVISRAAACDPANPGRDPAATLSDDEQERLKAIARFIRNYSIDDGPLPDDTPPPIPGGAPAEAETLAPAAPDFREVAVGDRFHSDVTGGILRVDRIDGDHYIVQREDVRHGPAHRYSWPREAFDGMTRLTPAPPPSEAPAVPAIVVAGREELANGTVRYRLSNGWFIDGAKVKAHYGNGYRFSAWQPGAHPSGCAAFRAGGDSLKQTLAKIQAPPPIRGGAPDTLADPPPGFSGTAPAHDAPGIAQDGPGHVGAAPEVGIPGDGPRDAQDSSHDAGASPEDGEDGEGDGRADGGGSGVSPGGDVDCPGRGGGASDEKELLANEGDLQIGVEETPSDPGRPASPWPGRLTLAELAEFEAMRYESLGHDAGRLFAAKMRELAGEIRMTGATVPAIHLARMEVMDGWYTEALR